MPSRQKKTILFSLFIQIALGLSGLFLWGFPADPDAVFGASRLYGVILIFGYFCYVLFHWGDALTRWCKLETLRPLLSWAFGSLFFSFLFPAFAALGLLGPRKDIALIGVISSGPLLNALISSPSENIIAERSKLRSKWISSGSLRALLILVGVLFLARFAVATLASGTSDPFLYHLYAPRAWWSQGSISFLSLVPIAMTSSLWEYLIGYGSVFFAELPNRGLIEGQLFGQFLQVTLGFGGCILALTSIARTFRFSRATSLIIAVLAVSSAELWIFSWIAKNDFGVMLWALSAIAIFISPSESINPRRRMIASGIFAGAAIAAKWNMALLLVPVFTFFLVSEPLIAALWFAGSTLAASLPILFRNAVLTHNPVYPLLGHLFRSSMNSLEAAQGIIPVGANLKPVNEWPSGIYQVLSDNPANFAAMLIPILFIFYRRKQNRYFWILAWASLAISLLFGIWSIPNSFLRWLGLPLLLLPAFGFAGLTIFVQELKRPKLLLTLGILLIVAIAYRHLERDYKPVLTAFNGVPPNEVIRNNKVHLGGSAKAWLRMNATPQDLIISTGDNQVYYLGGLNFRILGQDLELTLATQNLQSAEALLQYFETLHVRFLLDTTHWTGDFWTRQAFLLNPAISAHPNSIVFQGVGTRVIDLRKLAQNPASQ